MGSGQRGESGKGAAQQLTSETQVNAIGDRLGNRGQERAGSGRSTCWKTPSDCVAAAPRLDGGEARELARRSGIDFGVRNLVLYPDETRSRTCAGEAHLSRGR